MPHLSFQQFLYHAKIVNFAVIYINAILHCLPKGLISKENIILNRLEIKLSNCHWVKAIFCRKQLHSYLL